MDKPYSNHSKYNDVSPGSLSYIILSKPGLQISYIKFGKWISDGSYSCYLLRRLCLETGSRSALRYHDSSMGTPGELVR